MSVKSLIINGLHRSGTTMTERLFDSQDGVICFTLVMQAMNIISLMRNYNGKEYIMLEDFEHGPNKVSEDNYVGFRKHLITCFVSSILYEADHPWYDKGLASDTLHGFPLDKLLECISILRKHPDPTDLATMLQKIGTHLGVSVAAIRWTCHHRYAPVFLRTNNAYWLELLRSPYGRLASERSSHAGDKITAYRQINDNFNFSDSFTHPRYKVVRYEDLCNNTEKCLESISGWLGHDIRNVDLVTAKGDPFRANTSEHARQGLNVDTQDSSINARLGSMDMDRWRELLSPTDISEINYFVDFRGFYEKEPSPIRYRIAVFFLIFNMLAMNYMKKAIKTLFNAIGLSIGRKVKHPTL